jgi:hypothetical protein
LCMATDSKSSRDHWVRIDTRPDDGTGRTVCNCPRVGGLTGATPVEAFEAGAAHTAAEQLTTGRDEWPAEEPASRAGRAAAAAHRPRAAGAAVDRYVHDRRPDGQGHRSRLCVCRTVDVTADNHRHLPGVDSLRCVVMTAARKVTAPARERPLALLYRRVSSRQQVELGASLDSQATVLIAECDRRGWGLAPGHRTRQVGEDDAPPAAGQRASPARPRARGHPAGHPARPGEPQRRGLRAAPRVGVSLLSAISAWTRSAASIGHAEQPRRFRLGDRPIRGLSRSGSTGPGR